MERNGAKPMPATLNRRNGRISLRVTSEQKEFILRAAELETAGDLTRFIADAAIKAARNAIEEHGVSQVTDPVRQRFYDLLINPPAPSKALIALMASDDPPGYEIEE
jgi:uncharacterized protein (DUF1778 family)